MDPAHVKPDEPGSPAASAQVSVTNDLVRAFNQDGTPGINLYRHFYKEQSGDRTNRSKRFIAKWMAKHESLLTVGESPWSLTLATRYCTGRPQASPVAHF